MVIKVFMLGAVMVVPLVIYRFLWNFFPNLSLTETLKPLENKEVILSIFQNASITLPLSLIFLFLTIGVVEEYAKHFIAKKVDKKEITSIDDAIEFSIIAALGFSFAENTFYFIEIWQNLGTDLLLRVFIFRSIFSTFAHVLFSAVYGYHFGLALFAKPLVREKKKKSPLTRGLYKFYRTLRLKGEEVFEKQHAFVGLFYASSLHALFNIFLEIGYTKFLIPFLVIGVIHVIYMIWKRENHVEYEVNK